MIESTPQKMASITKQELASLPSETFCGTIKVVENTEDIEYAISKLNASDIIGFDTETKPSFKRGRTHKVSLLQLSTKNECFLFRINKIGFPDTLKDLIEKPDLLKIGLSIHDDFHNLNKIIKLNPQGFIDLQSYVKNYKIADNSLSRIYAIIFGKRISKRQRLSNWEAENLSEAQQNYAALDALACVKIYQKLEEGAFMVESSPFFREINNVTTENQSE